MKFTYSDYRLLLEELLKNHIPINYTQLEQNDKPAFLLRHDIDYGLEFLGDIPVIEHELNISATYFLQTSSMFYNVFSEQQVALIRQLQELNHRIGLHTDSTARVPKAEINNFIAQEISLLSHIVPQIDAVSFHQPPGYIVNNEVKINYINTYDRQDMKGFVYISDSSGRWAIGDPLDFLKKNKLLSFQILVHPIAWSEGHINFVDQAENSILQKANILHEYLVKYGHYFSARKVIYSK